MRTLADLQMRLCSTTPAQYKKWLDYRLPLTYAYLMGEGIQQRKVYLDIMRFLAIIAVLLNHTSFFPYTMRHPVMDMGDAGMLFLSVLIKIGVPMFFMLSGALLMGKDEPLGTWMNKRVLRFCLAVLLFIILQIAYGGLRLDVPPTSLQGWCSYAARYMQHPASVQWFMAAYLGFLLTLPFLRAMVRHMPNSHFICLFTLFLLLIAYMPCQHPLIKWMPLLNFPQEKHIYIFLFLGYYLEHRLPIDKVKFKHLAGLTLLSLASIIYSATVCELNRCFNHSAEICQAIPCFQGCVFLPCATLYLLIKKACRCYSLPGGVTSLLGWCSQATFTIVITENILRNIAANWINHMSLSLMGYSATVAVIAYLLGVPLGVLCKQIPGLRQIL